MTSATGSAGTIAAGEYLKDTYGTKVLAAEALECPTLLENGYGEHNIQGIGDKHVPLIHNVMRHDLVAAVSDRATDHLEVMFNEPEGLAHLAARGVATPVLAALADFGFSSICNVLAAISGAKVLGLGPDDVVVTVATDGGQMYAVGAGQDRAARLRRASSPALDAAAVWGEHLANVPTDATLELTERDRNRIFNLGYYTWVEQQGTPFELFERRRGQAFWRGLRALPAGVGRADHRLQRPGGGAVMITRFRRRRRSEGHHRGMRYRAAGDVGIPMGDVMRPCPSRHSWSGRWPSTAGTAASSACAPSTSSGRRADAGPRRLRAPLATPVGPAAGPHTQLAQNIVTAWLAGARVVELKTVQVLDGDAIRAAVPKPCINAEDEGFNCEWSTELHGGAGPHRVRARPPRHPGARRRARPRHATSRSTPRWATTSTACGSPVMDDFIEGLRDASATPAYREAMAWLEAHLGRFTHFDRAHLERDPARRSATRSPSRRCTAAPRTRSSGWPTTCWARACTPRSSATRRCSGTGRRARPARRPRLRAPRLRRPPLRRRPPAARMPCRCSPGSTGARGTPGWCSASS